MSRFRAGRRKERRSPISRALRRTASRQLFVRASNGQTIQLTHAQGDVVDAAWSPDGRELAFVATDRQDSAPFFFAGDNDYTATSLTPSEHLWIVSAGGGKATRLTSGSWTIAPTDPGGIFSPQIAWTHDGRRITYTRVENTFSGDSEYSTLWQIDVGTHATQKLTGHSAFELSPAYSPDGSRLAYWYPFNGDFNAENTLREVRQGTDTQDAAALDRNVAASLWLPDSRHLLVCAADGTQNVLWRVGLGETRRIPLGDLHPVCDPYSSSTFDAGIAGDVARDGSIAFVATSATSARELYYVPAASTTPRRLTHVNAFLSQLAVGRMSELNWTGPDGFAEDGVVTDPPNAQPGAKYPVVLLIHGGPGLSSSRDFVWEAWPLAQMIASRGYVVLQPNYRGSDNLGNAYMTAIVHNTVVGPSADILAGLDALERRGGIDAFAGGGLRLVVRRRADVVADRSRSSLAGSRLGCRRQQRVRRIQSLDVKRAGSLSVGSVALHGRRPAHLSRQLADHVLRADHDADVDLGDDARPGRADHAVVRALPRAHR